MNGNQAKFEEIVKNEFPALLQMIHRNMDLSRWGFEQVAVGIFNNFPPGIIFDSIFCRVRVMWHLSDIRDGNYKKITFLYGRLHAPVDESVIVWEGEKCYCWHSIEDFALNFLDDLSPQDLTRTSTLPKIMKKYYQPSIIHELGLQAVSENETQPEVMTRTHAEVWNHYGQQLFDLFDVRHPEIWNRYRMFVKEYYRLYPPILKRSPSLDSIC